MGLGPAWMPGESRVRGGSPSYSACQHGIPSSNQLAHGLMRHPPSQWKPRSCLLYTGPGPGAELLPEPHERPQHKPSTLRGQGTSIATSLDSKTSHPLPHTHTWRSVQDEVWVQLGADAGLDLGPVQLVRRDGRAPAAQERFRLWGRLLMRGGRLRLAAACRPLWHRRWGSCAAGGRECRCRGWAHGPPRNAGLPDVQAGGGSVLWARRPPLATTYPRVGPRARTPTHQSPHQSPHMTVADEGKKSR